MMPKNQQKAEQNKAYSLKNKIQENKKSPTLEKVERGTDLKTNRKRIRSSFRTETFIIFVAFKQSKYNF